MNAVQTRARAKADWRAQFKSLLATALTADRKAEWDLQIQAHVRQLLPPQGGFIAAYIARPDEPQVHQDLTKHDPQWRWVFPKVEASGLRFYLPQSPLALVQGSMGLTEPDPAQSTPVELKDCAVVLVPGIGFDRRGTRMGRGLGHFDRALTGYTGLKVGVAYSVQVSSEDMPREPHDVGMDVIVTEKFKLRVKG